MRLRDIEALSRHTALSHHYILDRDHSQIDPKDFASAFLHVKVKQGNDEAGIVMSSVVREVRRLVESGEIADAPIAGYRLPKARLTHQEVVAMMNPLEVSERQAILLALTSQMSLTRVTQMRRVEAMSLVWEPFCAQLLRATVPHINSGYVFWKSDDMGAPVPLLDLEDTWSKITGEKWFAFVGRFGQMLDYQQPDAKSLFD